MLRRHQHLNWFVAHFISLHAVTPNHGRKIFKHCGIPLCHNFISEVKDDEGYFVVQVMVAALLFYGKLRKFFFNAVIITQIRKNT